MAAEEASVPTPVSPELRAPEGYDEKETQEGAGGRTFLIFRDVKRLYALDAAFVNLLAEAHRPVWVPSPSKLLLGVIHLHGQFIPLCDLHRALGHQAEDLEGPGEMLESRLILLEIDGRKLAFNVPTVLTLVEVSESAIHPMSGAIPGQPAVSDRGLLSGFFEEAGEAVTVIDARKLLSALKAVEAA